MTTDYNPLTFSAINTAKADDNQTLSSPVEFPKTSHGFRSKGDSGRGVLSIDEPLQLNLNKVGLNNFLDSNSNQGVPKERGKTGQSVPGYKKRRNIPMSPSNQAFEF